MKVTMRANKANSEKLRELSQTQAGTVSSMSAEDIFLTAHKVLMDMGAYKACHNDCQTYANNLIKELIDDGDTSSELPELDISIAELEDGSGLNISVVVGRSQESLALKPPIRQH